MSKEENMNNKDNNNMSAEQMLEIFFENKTTSI